MKIVIIGSSSGIGRTIMGKLLAQKCKVWGMARRSQSDFLHADKDNFYSTQGDASCWSDVEKLTEQIENHWGSIDALIICAGIQGEVAPLTKVDPQRWSDTAISNINSTFFPMRSLSPLLLRSNNRAKVICFSGGGATKARPYFSAYATAKAGIVRLVETAADEWCDKNIDINAIAPGRINTAMMHEVIAKGPALVGKEEYASALKQQSGGGDSLDAVFSLIEWLLSSKSDGITGKLISAQWDEWKEWNKHLKELQTTDVYTLRRIAGRDRGFTWGDKK